MSLEPPYLPFRFWPIQLADPRFGYMWFTEPCVLINQVCVPRATTELVSALHDGIDRVIEREAEAIERHHGIVMIHDWRRLQGYDTAARREYLARMRRRKGGYLRQAVAVLPSTPLIKMAVQTADLVMALGVGGKLTFANDIDKVLERFDVKRPLVEGWR